MKASRVFWRGTLALLLTVGFSRAASPQSPSPRDPEKTVRVRASTEYDKSGFWRFLFGEEWRDTWSTAIEVPVLDLHAFAGGLTPYKKGGNQSATLRFHGGDGRTYIFRSTRKTIHKALPDDIKDTPIGDVIQDQSASFHPTGHLAVSELQKAAGVLFAPPTLVYMPDDARLGEFRKEFANSLGQIEERPDESEEGKTFAGAEKILGADKLLENLEESMEDRFDSRDYLAARLIDFLIGDPDRGGDQWRFAKLEAGERDVYRPIPRDRDYAFMKTDGLLMGVGAKIYPKLVKYRDTYPKLQSLLFMTREFDRSHLIDLSWDDWQSVITKIKSALTNDVIDRAVAQLPPSHRATSGPRIASGLRARRDNLAAKAREYYLMVNQSADIFASDEAERAEITREPDGSVRVKLWREGEGGDVATNGTHTPVFDRQFVPAETREIRVFLERGNDRALVRGSVGRSIKVRVIGGEGDDVLIDSSRVAGSSTRFYDASGRNTIVKSAGTLVNTTEFVISPPMRSFDEEENAEPEKNPRMLSEERRGRFNDLMADGGGFVVEKTRIAGARNWGRIMKWTPAIDYREQAGVVLGFGPTWTTYGFRHMPYGSKVSAHAMVGTTSGELGVRVAAERFFEASNWSVGVEALATQIGANRFYGFGNNTDFVDNSLSLIERDEASLFGALRYVLSNTAILAFGPVIKYISPDIPEGSPAEFTDAPGTEAFGQVGARAELNIDASIMGPAQQRGFGVQVGGSAYPAVWDASEPFGEAHAIARVYIPLGWPTVALRAGGQRVWGTFPLHESAFIGGRTSVRGFSWNRFAGDASVFGNAELHVPVARITLLTRGQFGLIGFSDAGRVWLNGDSEGDWHTSVGGGVWFSTIGHALSVTYAKGEKGKVYVSLGMPF